jgi:hypothetical protein
MKTVILKRSGTETDTPVEEYVHEFQNRTGKTIEVVEADSPGGVELAELHDIVQFPAILVTEQDGQFVQSWTEFDKWPTVSELSFYNQ